MFCQFSKCDSKYVAPENWEIQKSSQSINSVKQMSYQVGVMMLDCCGLKNSPYKKEPTQDDPIFQHLYPKNYDEDLYFNKLFGGICNIHHQIKTLILALI